MMEILNDKKTAFLCNENWLFCTLTFIIQHKTLFKSVKSSRLPTI